VGSPCSTNGGEEEFIYDIGGETRRKEPVGRPRCRWVGNITSKIDLREIGWDGMDWIDLAQDRDQWTALVNAVIYLWVP
jgi:hypothetical protein